MIFLAAMLGLLSPAQADAPPASPPLRIGTVAMQTHEWTAVVLDESGDLRGTVDGAPMSVPLSDVLHIAPVHPDNHAIPSAPREPSVTVFLGGGGTLAGDLVEAEKSAKPRLSVALSAELTIDVPFQAIAAIRTGARDADAEADFQRRIAERKPGRDIMLLVREGRSVAIPGSLEQLTPRQWEFGYESNSRTGALTQAYGFILGAPGAQGVAPAGRVTLFGGNRLQADVRSIAADGVRVDAGPLGSVHLPWSHVRSIELQSDRLVHLSDLKPQHVETQSFTEAPWPPRMNENVTGGPLRIARRTYASGVGVHAHNRLTYRLGRSFERFHAQAGIDDSVAPAGSVIFRVLGDGRTLFESPLVRGGDAPAAITLDVTGVESLVLECDPADDLDLSDHGNWVDAVLIRAAGGSRS